MKNFFILLVMVGMSLSRMDAFSQEKGTLPTLTLEECVQLALKNRPELEMATMDIRNAEHQIQEAKSYYYPRLNLSAGYTRFNRPTTFDVDIDVSEITGPVNDILGQYGIKLPSTIQQSIEVGKTNWYSVMVDLNQPLYTFGRIKEGVNLARLGHSITLNQKEKKRREIISEVKKGYYQFLFTKEIHHLLKEAEIRANVVAKMVKLNYEISIPDKEDKGTTRIDYLKSKNFLSEIKARLSEMGKNLRLAEMALKMAVGVNQDYPLSVVERSLSSIPVALHPSQFLKEKIRERNIDLKNLDVGVQLFDSKRKVAKKEYFPKVGFQGQYIGPEDRYGVKHFWYLGIGVTMPLFDGFLTKAKVGQAEAQFQKTKSQKLQLEAALAVQIDQLHSTLTELQERINILQGAIQEAQERAQLAADGYSAGMTEYDEFLLAQKTELEMKSAYLQCLFHYQMTLSDIELISGDL